VLKKCIQDAIWTESSVEAKMSGAIPPVPEYFFTAWCLTYQ